MSRYYLTLASLILLTLQTAWAPRAELSGPQAMFASRDSGEMRQTEKRLSIEISLENSVLNSGDPAFLSVRVTNSSDTAVPSSDFLCILFMVSRRPFEEGHRTSGQSFLGIFSDEKFEPTNSGATIPKELKSKETLDLKVNLSEGVWQEGISSSVNFDQASGLYPMRKGRYYLNASITFANSDGGKLVFRSNEIEVQLK